jgi:hypothetical protein
MEAGGAGRTAESTGWKPALPMLKIFSEQLLMDLRPSRQRMKSLFPLTPTLNAVDLSIGDFF